MDKKYFMKFQKTFLCWTLFLFACGFNLEHCQKSMFSTTVKKVKLSISFLFPCSEDGFYATWIKAPLEGGQWSVEAISLSPFHGMRMAQPQPLLRTKPIHVKIDGIPISVRRGETVTNFTVMVHNNMPISLQV